MKIRYSRPVDTLLVELAEFQLSSLARLVKEQEVGLG